MQYPAISRLGTASAKRLQIRQEKCISQYVYTKVFLAARSHMAPVSLLHQIDANIIYTSSSLMQSYHDP